MIDMVLLAITAFISGIIIGYCGTWIHDVIEEKKNDS